ncbi:MAG TPA: DNA polymerase IV [Chloroflexota bacterium]|nr:DNA polymerase IV [Chloroflexota bacterium]
MAVERACLYVDADRFFFSVEALERPGLADDPRPVVISADPRVAPRAVVTTANDAARKLGITSALSAAIALRRAPDAVFLPPRHELYAKHSARLMALLRTESPLVQQNSIDEAALRWEHRGFDREPAVRLRRRVLDELGLSVSLGLAANPLVAKMASEAAKSVPDHVHVVPPGEEAAFLAPMPVRALIGVGPKAEARLRALGIETIGVLAERPLADLVEAFGQSYGRYLHRASRGEDDSELTDAREWKSISAENTFGADTRDRVALWRELRSQAWEVARRLRGERLLAGEVAIKLRYANWETITRQMRLGAPTDDAELIAAAAAALMRRHWDRARAIRLLGVRAGKLQPAGDAVQQALLEL